MAPREATIKAMEEVSGPVVSIALILAAVFIPVAFMGGIQGSLNKQFALTIAIVGADLGLQRPDAVAGAGGDVAAAARAPGRWSGGFFRWFNRRFDQRLERLRPVSRALIRKAVLGVAILLGFTLLAAGLGRRLPTSFVPEEDYGYFMLNVQLPPAASLQRTDAVCPQGRENPGRDGGHPGLQHHRRLQPADPRDRAEQRLLLRRPEAVARPRDGRPGHRQPPQRARSAPRSPKAPPSPVMPPAIPGLGSQGGFSFWLQDRTGGSIENLDANLQQFLAAARKRPELGTVNSPFSAAVPQVFVDVDRDKVLKEGIALADVYQTMQTFLGGLYVNQFNRFGRQWRVFLQAEGAERTSPESIGAFYVRNNDGQMVPMSSLQTTRATFGPQYTNRFNVYRAAQVTGTAAPGYSSGQALDALEEVARETLPRGFSYDWADLSFQERRASGNAPAPVRAVAGVRVPDPRRALRELDAAVLGAAVGAGRGGRRLPRPDAAEVRLRRLRPGRHRHADRARRQERDPDRRVRQSPARRRRRPRDRGARRRQGCGCGRS